MNKFFYLLLIPMLCSLMACNDDKDDEDAYDNSHDINVVGNWQYMSGSYSKSYEILSLASNNTGHYCGVTFSGSKISEVNYNTLTWSINQTTKTLTLKFSNGNSISYKVSDENSSGLYLTPTTKGSSTLWSREPNVAEILSTFKKWKGKVYDNYTGKSSTSYYYYDVYDFSTTSRGNLEYYQKKYSESTYKKYDYPYSWSLDETGALTINFDDGDKWSYVHVSFIDGNNLYFFEEGTGTNAGNIYYYQLTPVLE